MKTIFLTIVFVLFIPLSFFVMYNAFLKDATRPSDDVPTQLPNDQVSLPSQDGDDVIVRDFTKSPAVVPDTDNQNLYFYGESIEAATANKNFMLSYDSGSGYFNIVLTGQPFNQARLQAESALKEVLDAPESQLCQLSYTVTVPGYVDDAASGIDYRFSFCSDAITL